MMKLVAGKRVACEIVDCDYNVIKVTDAKLQEGKGNWEGRWFICQNDTIGLDCRDKLGYKYSWSFRQMPDGSLIGDVYNLHYVDSTDIEDVYVGAKIKNNIGIREVLGISGRVIFLSDNNDYNSAFNSNFTIEELKKGGFTLIPEWTEKDGKRNETLKRLAELEKKHEEEGKEIEELKRSLK